MRQTFEFATAEGVVRVERDYQEINVQGPVADESWRFTDGNGHEHCYRGEKDPEAERGGHYPTLVYVPGPDYYCTGCNDEHEDYAVSHYECRICGETVEPGSREPRNPEALMLTRQAAHLDGELITRERAEDLLSAAETARHADGNEYRISLATRAGALRPGREP
jgi:hypothetical protein